MRNDEYELKLITYMLKNFRKVRRRCNFNASLKRGADQPLYSNCFDLSINSISQTTKNHPAFNQRSFAIATSKHRQWLPISLFRRSAF